jgi:hypothetical protein
VSKTGRIEAQDIPSDASERGVGGVGNGSLAENGTVQENFLPPFVDVVCINASFDVREALHV